MQDNLIVPRNHDLRKKVRGSRRKLHSFERKLESIVVEIPDGKLPRDTRWRYPLPSPSKLVDSTDSSYKLRKKFLQMLADKLVELDTSIQGRYRALLILSLPFLSHSRIEICVDEKYFESLANNSDSPSGWTPIAPEKDIVREFTLVLPEGYRTKGYCRNSVDSKLREENWIIWKERGR